MSDLEDGEIEGELGPVPQPPSPPKEQLDDFTQRAQHAQSPPAEPRERLLAPRAANGRAPYYAEPDTNGFRGRGGGGKKKKKKAAAAGFVDVYGKGAAASVELRREEGPIRLADVQALVLWVLAEGSNPRWCFVKNKPLVSRVLLLAAHGLDAATWEAAAAAGAMPAWRARLGDPIELQARNATLAPGSTVHSLLTVVQPRKRRREDAPAATGGGEAAVAPAQQQQGDGNAAAGAQAGAGSKGIETPGGPADAANAGTTEAAAAAAAARGAYGADGDVPPAAAPAAKRMKLAAGDDVSSAVQPAVDGAAAAAQQQEGQAAQQEGQAQEQQPPANGHSAASYPMPPSHYVLTLEQLAQHGYPLPQWDEEKGEMATPAGFVATKASKGGPPLHDMVALDCEMCITEAGFELTRVVLLDKEGQVLLDELVVPHNPITDHNTRFSGITPEMLEGVTTRLADVQARFRSLVAAETLVVAHSGENDLQALKIIHANVIDTALLFPHPRGPPFKSALRVLASRHLLRTIQQGEHNPVEDARAALDLALLKFTRGPAYGVVSGERGERLTEVLSNAGRTSTLVDRLEVLSKQVSGACSAVAADGDAEAVTALGRELRKPKVSFLWGQLGALQRWHDARLAAARDAALPEPTPVYRLPAGPGDTSVDGPQQQHQQQQEQPQQQQQQQGPAADGQQTEARGALLQGGEAEALAELDASLEALWAAAPAGTLLLVVTGQGDTGYCRYLLEQKWRRQQGLDGLPPWSPAVEAHHAAWQERVQRALCFAAVKQHEEAQAAPAAAAVAAPAAAGAAAEAVDLGQAGGAGGDAATAGC